MSLGTDSYVRVTAAIRGVIGRFTVYRLAFEGEFLNLGHTTVVKTTDEGVTWIRGWHEDGSEELAALRVATALEDRPVGFPGVTGATGPTGCSTGPQGERAKPWPSKRMQRPSTPQRFHPIPAPRGGR